MGTCISKNCISKPSSNLPQPSQHNNEFISKNPTLQIQNIEISLPSNPLPKTKPEIQKEVTISKQEQESMSTKPSYETTSEKKQSISTMIFELSQSGIQIQQIINQLGLQESFLNRNQDAAWINKSNQPKYRGRINSSQKQYFQPIGYYGIGLSVSKFGNQSVLHSDDNENTWITLYHKTRPEYVLPILQQGFKAGGGQSFQSHSCLYGRGIVGIGVYFSDVIEQTHSYGTNLMMNNQQIQIIIQCRVNPKTVKNAQANIFVVANPADIIPYRILIKKL